MPLRSVAKKSLSIASRSSPAEVLRTPSFVPGRSTGIFCRSTGGSHRRRHRVRSGVLLPPGSRRSCDGGLDVATATEGDKIMSKPLPLPVFDRRSDKLFQEFMDDST